MQAIFNQRQEMYIYHKKEIGTLIGVRDGRQEIEKNEEALITFFSIFQNVTVADRCREA